jgi:hypothetical protein
MVNYGKYKKHSWFIGIINRFQWVGIMISTDNPIAANDYFLFEFRFLWLRVWYTYDFSDQLNTFK